MQQITPMNVLQSIKDNVQRALATSDKQSQKKIQMNEEVQLTEKSDGQDALEPTLNPQDQSQIKPSENQPQPHKHSTIKYRNDVDGIRAVAILLVLIYHAFPSKLTGGFIGVDVFFVISGFLITQIIVKQTLKNKFSILNFYARRVKRIYPALIVVLSFALWVISQFTQIDLAEFSLETLNASLIFCANIRILAHKQDYFDADIRGNPLLHLWSLGVEEQFYIVWPFLIYFTFKYWQKRANQILAVFTVCSFILAIVCVYQSAKFAFYFPLCRFWQMSVGGMLGVADVTFRDKKINNALSVLGLLAILITSFVINDESLFPGFWSLLPTLGCALIIQAKSEALLNKYILSNRLVTFIGNISYSLYLWHWPLIVYSRVMYPHGSKSIFGNMYFIVGMSVGLSILSYYILENPVRKIRTKKVAILLLFIMGGVGIASIFVNKYAQQKYSSIDGIDSIEFYNKVNRQMAPEEEDYVMINGKRQPNFSANKKRQIPNDVSMIKANMLQLKDEDTHGYKLLQKPARESQTYGEYCKSYAEKWLIEFYVANEGQDNHLMLIGDSHTQRLSYRFQELFRRNQIKGTLDSFPTIIYGVRRGWLFGQDNPMLNMTRTLIQMKKPKRILFSWNWIVYFCHDLSADLSVPANCDQDRAKGRLDEYVTFLQEIKAMGIEVYSIGVDINVRNYNPINMFDANGIIEENLKPFRYSDFKRKYQFMFDLVEGSLNAAKIDWIDTSNNLCWDDWCQVISPKGYAGFCDIDHMGKFLASNWITTFDHLAEF